MLERTELVNQVLRSPARAFSPVELREVLSSGLMSFPLTDFDQAGDFDEAGYRNRLEWLMPYGATVLFAAGGTGEVFSMTPAEQARVTRVAVETCGADTPIIAGACYGTRLAIEMAQAAEAAGAAGILPMPHYLTEASQKGLAAHIEAVCNAIRIGVVVYNRNVCKLEAETVARLAERNPNLIGFKDGVGDIEAVMAVRNLLGDRLSYLGGLPTAEVFAEAYNAAGFPGLFVGGVQLHSQDGDGVLRSGADRRPVCHAAAAEGVLLPLPRDPQPFGRLCGVDREGRCEARRAWRRPGAAAAH